MRKIAFLVLCAALSGCGLIYKTDVQQGNILDQDMVDQLRPGMSKRQVELILGTPAIADPFHQDRWDYISTFKQDGKIVNRKLLSVTFRDDRLVKIEGDYKPGETTEAEEEATDD